MIEVQITNEMLGEAYKKAEAMGVLRNSILKGKGNVYGFLGEMIVAQYLGVPLDNTYDYDLIYEGIKLDVKSKKRINEPKRSWFCAVSARNTTQKCDAYVFTNIMSNFSKGWILGFYPKDAYLENADFFKKGTRDKQNGIIYREDCYLMQIKDVFPIESLKEMVK